MARIITPKGKRKARLQRSSGCGVLALRWGWRAGGWWLDVLAEPALQPGGWLLGALAGWRCGRAGAPAGLVAWRLCEHGGIDADAPAGLTSATAHD